MLLLCKFLLKFEWMIDKLQKVQMKVLLYEENCTKN